MKNCVCLDSEKFEALELMFANVVWCVRVPPLREFVGRRRATEPGLQVVRDALGQQREKLEEQEAILENLISAGWQAKLLSPKESMRREDVVCQLRLTPP